VSYMDMEFWQSHVSEALHNLLSRDVKTRPSAQQVSQRLSVYVQILKMPTIANAVKGKMYPAYREWNNMVDMGRVTGEFLLGLRRQYLVDGAHGIYWLLLEVITHVIPDATKQEVHLGSLGGMHGENRVDPRQSSTTDVAIWKHVGEILYANHADHAGTSLYKALLREIPDSVHASLRLAVMHGDKFSIRSLSLLGHDIYQRDNEARTLMHHAAENGHLEVVKFLVGAKANVESKDKDGRTPLSHAAMNSHLEVVNLLVEEAGAKVDSKDEGGLTPLSLATTKGHLEVVKFLV